MHHMGDGACLLIISQQLLIVHQLLHMVSPRAIVAGFSEDIKEFACCLWFIVENSTARHVFQQINIPTVFHAILHTDTVTLVHNTIVIEHDATCHMIHINR